MFCHVLRKFIHSWTLQCRSVRAWLWRPRWGWTDIPLAELISFVFTRKPGDGVCRQFGSLMLCPLFYVWHWPSCIASVCWLGWRGLILFMMWCITSVCWLGLRGLMLFVVWCITSVCWLGLRGLMLFMVWCITSVCWLGVRGLSVVYGMALLCWAVKISHKQTSGVERVN